MTKRERKYWNNELHFLMSLIGTVSGLTNFFQSPHLVYTNGGIAFFIPYLLILAFGAIPLLYFEFLLGQTQQESCIRIWNMCPFFKGIGVSQVLIQLCFMNFYNLIIVYCLYILLAVIIAGPPWNDCLPLLSTQYCHNIEEMHGRNILKANYTEKKMPLPSHLPTKAQLGGNEYFERAILFIQDSAGLNDLGKPRWQIVYCEILICTLIFFFVWKGVKSLEKVVCVFVGLPLVGILILFLRGCGLNGSWIGVRDFLSPTFSKLKDSQVWIDAGVHATYSLGVGLGTFSTITSYNTRKFDCFNNMMIAIASNLAIKITTGNTVFMYLGHLSSLTDLEVKNLVSGGPGFAFGVLPLAISSLPLGLVWSFVYFVILTMLGIGCIMYITMSICAGICDALPKSFLWQRFFSQEYISVIIISVCVLVSFILSTNGGILIQELMVRSISIPLVFVCVLQIVAVAWFYGLPQFCDDIQAACGYVPHIAWRIFWKIITPVFFMIILVLSIYRNPSFIVYHFSAIHPELVIKLNLTEPRTYTYPDWSTMLLSWLNVLQILPIPLFMLIALCLYSNFFHAIVPPCKHDDEATWEEVGVDHICAGMRRKSVYYYLSLGPEDDDLKANWMKATSWIRQRLKCLKQKSYTKRWNN